ncbi:MAG: DUF998 domain-containing protein [Pseudonocardiales bacterium]
MSSQRELRARPAEERADRVPGRRAVAGALAAAGIVGPIGYAGVALVHSLLRADHSLVADPIAELVTGPSGWVQHVNFMVLGLLIIAHAIGLHLGVRPTRWGVVGPAFLALAGLGQVWAGVVGPSPAPFAMTFLGAGIGLIVVSRRMARDPRWRNLASYALATGFALLAAIPAGVLLGIPPGGPPQPWSGLASWALATIWFTCTVVLALRLVRVTRTPDAQR